MEKDLTGVSPAAKLFSNRTPGTEAVGVLFSTDENYAPYTGVAIRSLVEHFNPARRLDVIIVEDGLSRHTRENLEACAATRPGVSLTFLDIEPFLKLKPEEYHTRKRDHISKATYYRLYAPEALADRDRVVYLDSDVIVLGDVAELYDSLDEGMLVAACVDLAGIVHSVLNQDNRDYVRKTLKMEDCEHVFNAGVMAMNLRAMRSEKIQEKFTATLRALGKPRLHDQDILNVVCAGRVCFLDHAWNYAGWYEYADDLDFERNLPDRQYANFVKAGQAPKVVHYNGRKKPWHRPDLPWASHFWDFARQTPFYERLLIDMTQHHVGRQVAKRKNVIDGESPDAKDYLVIRFNKALAKYRMYKVLSLFTMGKLRRHFIRLRDKHKARFERTRQEKNR